VVANDDQFQLKAVGFNLRASKINVIMEGVNGLEVLKYIWTNPDAKIDLVLLDLEMPIMNGYEACTQIIDLYKNSIFKLDKRQRKNGPSS
jgi:CheY-like chemotaxis protein